MLDGGEGQWARSLIRRRGRSGRRQRLRDAGEFGQGLVLEQVAGGEPPACLLGARHYLDGDDGVASQSKEVIGAMDGVQSEQRAPEGGEHLLGGRERFLVLSRGDRPARVRQRSAVEFTVG